MSLGIVGGIQLPQPIPREAIRKEGLRRHYDGEALEDFVEIVATIDDEFILLDTQKQAAAAQAAAKKSQKPQR
jgi:hypothetical protein